MSKAQEMLTLVEGITNQQRQVFVGYAVEILKKIHQEKKNLAPDAQIRALRTVMMNMAFDPSNPNYKNTRKFMPTKFDAKLFTNGDGNMYDSLWMSMNDAHHDTVFRQALKKFNREV